MPTLTIRLTDQAHELWTLHCKSQGEYPSTVVREWIETTLQEQRKLKPCQTKQARRDEPKQKIDVLLTLSEINAIRAVTQRLGGTRRGWIVDAIRVGLTHQPAFCKDEITALNNAMYEVRKINSGIRRWINTFKSKTLPTDAASIERLESMVSGIADRTAECCTKVDRLVDSNLQRWSIKS